MSTGCASPTATSSTCDLVVVSVGIRPHDLAARRGPAGRARDRGRRPHGHLAPARARRRRVRRSTAAWSTASSRRSTTRRRSRRDAHRRGGRVRGLGAGGEAEGDGRGPGQRGRGGGRARGGGRRRAATYRKLVVEDGRAAGAVLLGDTRGAELLIDAVRTGRAVDDPLALLAQAHRPRPPTCPTARRSATATGSARRRSSRRSASGELGSTAEVVAVTRAGSGCGSCKPVVTELLAPRARRRAEEPTYLCPCRRQTREELAALCRARDSTPSPSCRGVRRGSRLRRLQAGPRLPRLGGVRQPPSARSATRASSTTACTRTSSTTARSASCRASAAGSPRRRAAPDRRRGRQPRGADGEDHRRPADRPARRAQGAAAGDLGGPRDALRPRLREGRADREDVRRHRLLPLRPRRRGRVGIELERAWRACTRRTRSSRPWRAARATARRRTSRTSGSSPSRAAGSSTSAARPARPCARATCSRRSTADAEAMRVALAFLQHYREQAEYLERTYAYLERVGIDAVRAAVLDPGESARLLERYAIAKAAADPDPWRERARAGAPQAVRRARHRAGPSGRRVGSRTMTRCVRARRTPWRATTSRCSRGAARGRGPPDRRLPAARRVRGDRRRLPARGGPLRTGSWPRAA